MERLLFIFLMLVVGLAGCAGIASGWRATPTPLPSATQPGQTSSIPTLADATQPAITRTPFLPATAAKPVMPLPTAQVSFPSCQAASLTPEQLIHQAYPAAKFTPAAPGSRPSLRALAEARGIFIGTAASPSQLADADFARLLVKQFNMLTPENAMKWELVHPQPERYDFSQGDALVKFARQHKLAVHAHTLVWDLQLPDWVREGEHNREGWMQILCTHIKTVVGHYRGQVYAWDVVNEAVAEDGKLYDNFWLRAIGPDYIAMSFQWAHEADPGARLFYNDNGGEGPNAKSHAIYALLGSLKRAGIPLDGVGLQMHTALYQAPSPSALQMNMQRLSNLGLEIQITEMDVRLQHAEESEAYKLMAQAEIYRQVAAACLAVKRCTALITWGLTDRYSWIPGWTGQPDAPLLFDVDGKPKPAYWAVHTELSKPAQ